MCDCDVNIYNQPISEQSAFTIENVGGGSQVYKDATNNPVQLRTLTEGTNISIAQTDNEIQINAAISELTLNQIGDNEPASERILVEQTPTDYGIRGIIAGDFTYTNIDANGNIEIGVDNSGIASGANIGANSKVYVDNSAPDFRFRTIRGGTGISTSASTTEVTITNTTPTILQKISKDATEVISSLGSFQWGFRDIFAGNNIQFTIDPATEYIQISATGGTPDTIENVGNVTSQTGEVYVSGSVFPFQMRRINKLVDSYIDINTAGENVFLVNEIPVYAGNLTYQYKYMQPRLITGFDSNFQFPVSAVSLAASSTFYNEANEFTIAFTGISQIVFTPRFGLNRSVTIPIQVTLTTGKIWMVNLTMIPDLSNVLTSPRIFFKNQLTNNILSINTASGASASSMRNYQDVLINIGTTANYIALSYSLAALFFAETNSTFISYYNFPSDASVILIDLSTLSTWGGNITGMYFDNYSNQLFVLSTLGILCIIDFVQRNLGSELFKISALYVVPINLTTVNPAENPFSICTDSRKGLFWMSTVLSSPLGTRLYMGRLDDLYSFSPYGYLLVSSPVPGTFSMVLCNIPFNDTLFAAFSDNTLRSVSPFNLNAFINVGTVNATSMCPIMYGIQ